MDFTTELDPFADRPPQEEPTDPPAQETLVRQVIPPKVVELTDRHGDTWERCDRAAWKLNTSIYVVATTEELFESYAPLTPSKWATSRGLTNVDPDDTQAIIAELNGVSPDPANLADGPF